MGIFGIIKFLESAIRNAKIALDETCFGLVITVTYDYANLTPESMIEFDTDFATAMLDLGGEIEYSLENSLSIKIPNFSGSIVGSTMVGGSLWKAVLV